MKTNTTSMLLMGAIIVLALLSIPVPFFRHVIFFGSSILAVLCVIGMVSASQNKEKFIKKIQAEPSAGLPKWAQPVFFLTMIGITAGLRIGWYITPMCWAVVWFTTFSIQQDIKTAKKSAARKG